MSEVLTFILRFILSGLIGGVLLSLVFLFFFPVVQICGYSMFPTLNDQEIYFGRRIFNKSKCKVGNIYVYRPPYESEEEKFVIKRLAEIKDGKYFFLGDNPNDSYDSRYYGYVDSKNVVAQLLTRKGCK